MKKEKNKRQSKMKDASLFFHFDKKINCKTLIGLVQNIICVKYHDNHFDVEATKQKTISVPSHQFLFTYYKSTFQRQALLRRSFFL